MLLTISTTHKPATDMGFLLHKNPQRHQSADLSFGTAHVFYPEASNARCTVAVLVEVDPVDLVRNRQRPERAMTSSLGSVRKRSTIRGLVLHLSAALNKTFRARR